MDFIFIIYNYCCIFIIIKVSENNIINFSGELKKMHSFVSFNASVFRLVLKSNHSSED